MLVHYVLLLSERKTKELLFIRFLKVVFVENLPPSTGRNDRLQPGKLLNLMNISAVKQDNFQYHCFDVDGVVLCERPSVFLFTR